MKVWQNIPKSENGQMEAKSTILPVVHGLNKSHNHLNGFTLCAMIVFMNDHLIPVPHTYNFL